VATPSDSSDEEEVKKPAAKKVVAKKQESSDEESSEEVKKPAAKTNGNKATVVPAKKVAKKQESSDEESSEEVKKPAAKTVPAKKVAKKQESSDEESSEDVKPVAKKPAAKVAAKKEESSDEESDEIVPAKKAPVKQPAKQESEDEDEEDNIVQVKKPVQQQFNKPQNNYGAESDDGHSELFVKSLSYNSTEDSLYEYFGKYGTVENVKIVYDRETGKSRGFGFVKFATRKEAQACLNDASNINVDGRQVTMTFSNEKPEKPAGGFSGGNQRGGNNNFGGEKFSIFVGNLGFRTTEAGVSKFFQDCGTIVGVRVAKHEDGKARGFCHVDFDSKEAVEKAKAKAGQELDGREIRVDDSTPKQGGGSRGGFGGGRGRGGRGGSSGSYMDKAKKSGALIQTNGNAVKTFDDDE